MKKKFKDILVGILSVIAVIVALFIGFGKDLLFWKITNEHSYPAKIIKNTFKKDSYSCADIIKQLKSKTNLPQKIDISTSIIDYQCKDNNLIYVHKINDYYDKSLQMQTDFVNYFNNTMIKNSAKTAMLQNTCIELQNNSSFKEILVKNNLTLTNRYYLPDNSLLFDIYIDRNTCKSYQ